MNLTSLKFSGKVQDELTINGIITYNDDCKYEGEIKGGEIEGKGAYKNGSQVITGNWQKSKQHGNCEVSYTNKDSYTGEFKEGVKHGRGTYRWAN